MVVELSAPDTTVNRQWRGMLKLGAGAAVWVVVMIPLQAAVFLLSPPPVTVAEFFALFQRNPLLGLLDLDLLLSIDYVVMIPFYLALFAVLRRVAAAWSLLALILGLLSVTLFLVSREATFSMWLLSNQYAEASPAAQAPLLAAGQTLLTAYNGGTFATSYVLGALSTLIFSALIIRYRVLGRWAGPVGVLTGLTMLIPANVGMIGLTMSLVSLMPTAAWLILLSRQLLRVTRTSSEVSATFAGDPAG